jgi:hypothetical protein
VLRRLIGSAQVMHDQLTELAELSTRPYISIEVVPTDGGANAGLGGAVNIASGNGHPDALPRGQSRDLILRLADELWKA